MLRGRRYVQWNITRTPFIRTCVRRLLTRQYHCRSYVESMVPTKEIPTDMKSVFIVSTPDMITTMARQAEHIIESYNSEIQVIAASFDSVGSVDRKTGTMAELWMEDVVQVSDVELCNNKSQELSKSWHHDQGSVSVIIPDDSDRQQGAHVLDIKLGNTLFHNGDFEHLWMYQPESLKDKKDTVVFKDINFMKLRKAILKLPTLKQKFDMKMESNLELVKYEGGEEDQILIITDCKHNMVKEINDKPASSFLQDNPMLLANMTADCKIFAEIVSMDGKALTQRYEVVGGGGQSWGSAVKTKLLALEPLSNQGMMMNLAVNNKIKFYHLRDDFRYVKKNQVSKNIPANTISFGCTLQDQMGSSPTSRSNLQILECSFQIGSESGFIYNGTKYSANGDTLMCIPCT